tara:strand:- start:48688 stop:48945 length:258 start_codon:yes stop_codon:yes gene_type:complete
MKIAEQIQSVKEAIALVEEAKQLLEEAVEYSSCRAHYEGYEGYGIEQLLGNGNPHDYSLFKLMDDMKEQAAEMKIQCEHEMNSNL